MYVLFALGKDDESPSPSPKIITLAVDTGIPQSPMNYNGEAAAHVQVTPLVTDTSVVTESSPASNLETAVSGRDSESDSNTTCLLYTSDAADE